jgi:hypothetical protein
LKKYFAMGIILAVAAVIIVPLVALAGNTGTQGASTSGQSNSISIKAQDYNTDVSEITFPKGAPNATVSNPTNGVGTDQQQFGGAGVAKPVVTLVNSSGIDYNISYTITAFTNSVVANEYYALLDKGQACLNADAISTSVNFGANTNLGSIGADGVASQKDLYLKITLGPGSALEGTSSITILGELP